MQEMLWRERGVNWNDLPAGFKRGRVVERVRVLKDVEYTDRRTGETRRQENLERHAWQVVAPPVFGQDRDWLLSRIPGGGGAMSALRPKDLPSGGQEHLEYNGSTMAMQQHNPPQPNEAPRPSLRDNVYLLARYNRWQNRQLYATCAALTEAERRTPVAGYYGSVHGLLNHLLWGDRTWLGRFTGVPYVADLATELYADFEELRREREATDAAILEWAEGVSEERLGEGLTYTSSVDGRTRTLPLWQLAAHFFNHQTHHRGQVTLMLAVLGKEYPITDLPWMPPEADDA